MDRGFQVTDSIISELHAKQLHNNMVLQSFVGIFHFCFSFVSDTEIVFLDSKGGLSILDVTSLNQSQIVSNIVFVSTSNY